MAVWARGADRAAWAASGLCLAAALAAQGGRVSPALDLLTHLAPVWFAGAMVGLILRLAAPRPAALTVAVLAVVMSGALIAPELARRMAVTPVAASETHLRLIQFNASDGNATADHAAAWIAAQSPDLVAVEDTQPAIRAALEQHGFHYMRGMVETAIFSRAKPLAPPFMLSPHDWNVLPDFARASFAAPRGRFTLLAVHATRPTWNGTFEALAALANLASRYPTDTLLIAGDFNLTPWSFTLARLDARLGVERRDRALFSWPTAVGRAHALRLPLPLLPIDHIYAGRAWRTVRVWRGPDIGSPHYPIVADLALGDTP